MRSEYKYKDQQINVSFNENVGEYCAYFDNDDGECMHSGWADTELAAIDELLESLGFDLNDSNGISQLTKIRSF